MRSSFLFKSDGGFYLSLVVLEVEEGVIVRQFDHMEGMFSGFMNDGQVERPVGKGRERERKKERLVKIVPFQKKKKKNLRTEEVVPAK